MDFEIKNLALDALDGEKTDAVMLLVAEGFKPGRDAASALVQAALKSEDLQTKPGKLLSCYRPSGFAAARVLLVGVGQGSPKDVRQAVAAGVAALKGTAVKTLTIALGSAVQTGAVRAAVVAAAEASYVYTATLSKPQSRKLARVVLGVPDAAAFKTELQQARALVLGVEFAKEWANRPGNHATPTMLGKAAQGLGKQRRTRCEVLGPAEVAKLGMGSFMAVAQGSHEPLRFIVLRYQGAAADQAPVVLVGKGITFDTGGISIKPAPEMDEMKFDMGGAASVLGVFRALGELQPDINVVGLIAACENMPDGRAIKPGDVVTSMSGQTIEILNTDAEGRLILCDALTYAERFKPSVVIDIATLTGACVIALGAVRSGMYATEDSLAAALSAAGDKALDLCWRLPLDDEYAEGLKSNFADVANVAGRAGGSITAAKFLHRFAQKFPWAHLDIAGTAWKGGTAKGATGRPVGLLLQYLLDQASTPAVPAAKPRRVRK